MVSGVHKYNQGDVRIQKKVVLKLVAVFCQGGLSRDGGPKFHPGVPQS